MADDDKFWSDMEERNTGPFWKAEPDEAEEPTTLERVLDTVTIPAVTENRSHRHRARRARGRRVWVPALVGAVSVAVFGAAALWQAQDATLLSGNPTTRTTRVVTVTPSPKVMPGPTVTRWRDRKVKVPGPTKTVTQTPEPSVSVSTRWVTQEPEVVVSVKVGPTATVTVTKEVDYGFPFTEGE